MSDTVQVPDVIVGRAWLDIPGVAYHKSGGRLHLYDAKPCDGETGVAADVFRSEADYLHAVEVDALPVKEPLCVADFRYVDPEFTVDDEKGLLELVNEYRECFAKNLNELGCTPLMTVDINEMPNSRPVVCRLYKTTRADREEIAKIVLYLQVVRRVLSGPRHPVGVGLLTPPASKRPSSKSQQRGHGCFDDRGR